MYARCIPEYARSSYDMGIDDIKFRRDRDEIQRRQSIDRKMDEELLWKQQMTDLNV